MASEDGARGEMSDLNAIGTARYVGQRLGAEEGGNTGRYEAVDCHLPTSCIARGNEVRASDDATKGERKETSWARNKSIARGGSRR